MNEEQIADDLAEVRAKLDAVRSLLRSVPDDEATHQVASRLERLVSDLERIERALPMEVRG